jgi:hypothetical protein
VLISFILSPSFVGDVPPTTNDEAADQSETVHSTTKRRPWPALADCRTISDTLSCRRRHNDDNGSSGATVSAGLHQAAAVAAAAVAAVAAVAATGG